MKQWDETGGVEGLDSVERVEDVVEGKTKLSVRLCCLLGCRVRTYNSVEGVIGALPADWALGCVICNTVL